MRKPSGWPAALLEPSPKAFNPLSDRPLLSHRRRGLQLWVVAAARCCSRILSLSVFRMPAICRERVHQEKRLLDLADSREARLQSLEKDLRAKEQQLR